MGFKSKPNVVLMDGLDTVILNGALSYFDVRSKQLFVIPAGFVSDCATIPKTLWSVVGHPLMHQYRYPTILHDFLYGNGVVKRKTADKILRDALVYEGCDKELAAMFYLAVRTFGNEFYCGVK